MKSTGRRVRNAFILGLIFGGISLANQLLKEGIPYHPTPFGAPVELITEALTPAALFAFVAWLSTLRLRNRVEVPEEAFAEQPISVRPVRHQTRVARGFHRIGIVLAAPIVLVAIWLAVREAWLLATGVSNGQDGMIKGAFSDEIALMIFAALLYAVMRAIGWIIDGFARS